MEDKYTESEERKKAIEQFRNQTVAMIDRFKKVNFDLMKEEIAKGCMTDLSVVRNLIDVNAICEGGVTAESIINDGNNEIKKIIDSVTITDDELEEIKNGLLEKLNFEMSKGEMIFYQKVMEMASAYITINQISNSSKNSLLYVLSETNKNK